MHRLHRIISVTIGLIILLAIPCGLNLPGNAVAASPKTVDIKEWQVPWDQTRPRDPYVDQQHRVWFV